MTHLGLLTRLESLCCFLFKVLLEARFLGCCESPRFLAGTPIEVLSRGANGAHDVSPIVNSAKYDGPQCIQPVSDDEMPRGQLSLL